MNIRLLDLGLAVAAITGAILYCLKEQEVKALEKEIERSVAVPRPGVLDGQGLPASVAARYQLVYVQILLLADAAGVPDETDGWLRSMTRDGLLHDVLEDLYVLGMDTSGPTPQVAALLAISVDWDLGAVQAQLATTRVGGFDGVQNQRTMQLARAFNGIVQSEKLTVEVRYGMVNKPTVGALRTLGVHEDSKLAEGENFKTVVNDRLGLAAATPPVWRSENRQVLKEVSELTPELNVVLEYAVKEEPRLD